jgi:phosphomevalonate kinase
MLNYCSDGSKNKFVYIALQYTLKLVAEIKGAELLKNAIAGGLEITIVGGNDFYSQRAKVHTF